MAVAEQIVACLLEIDIVVFEFFENRLLKNNSILPDDDSLVDFGLFLGQVVPLAVLNLWNFETGLGVDIQYLFHEVFGIGRDEFRDLELPRKDLLVESVSILVFEGQIATEQSVHNYSAGPDINIETVVMLASDHLGGGIARRPTGGLEFFAGLVLIGEAEVDYLDIFIVVKQQVFRF